MVRLFQDYSIRRAHEGEKHYRAGWVNIPCPFCSGHSGNHLGFNLDKHYFKCWRCGHKPISKVLEKLLGISFHESKKIIREYKGKISTTPAKIKVVKVNFKMPSDSCSIINNKHAFRYMEQERGFTRRDIHWLAKKYLLQATGPLGGIKGLDLEYRIVAPIIHQGEVVSWQTRDYTDQAFLRYITCPAKVEKIEHKKVLYNAPDPEQYPVIVLCEGITDVWKVALAGFPATCCFGVEYTYDQLKLLTKYKKIVIFLDPDKAGSNNSHKLLKQLIFAGREAQIVENDTGMDAGDLSKEKISKLLNPLMKLAS